MAKIPFSSASCKLDANFTALVVPQIQVLLLHGGHGPSFPKAALRFAAFVTAAGVEPEATERIDELISDLSAL